MGIFRGFAGSKLPILIPGVLGNPKRRLGLAFHCFGTEHLGGWFWKAQDLVVEAEPKWGHSCLMERGALTLTPSLPSLLPATTAGSFLPEAKMD